MKKLFALLALTACVTARSYAQEVAYGKYQTRDNIIDVGFAYGLGSHNTIFYSASAGYMRRLQGNFHLGVIASRQYTHRAALYDPNPDSNIDPYANTVCPQITTLGVMAYHELPVAGRWLALRTGAGVDVGYHHLPDERSNSETGDKILPFLRAEARWVVNITPGFHLTLSPLILGPSYFSWSPFSYGPPTTLKSIWFTDFFVQFGFGVRF